MTITKFINGKALFQGRRSRPGQQRGFALIVTLSLMILLTVIAVGLLSLSSVSLRASARGNDGAVAKANARLALMMAIGQLQSNAGPDQRVTARADVLDADIENPRLTGVWKSWQIKADNPPSPSSYERNTRDLNFLGWLTSSANGLTSEKINFAAEGSINGVKLWDKGTVGDHATDADIVYASKILTSPTKGALAWATMDEGIKARVNTPYSDDASEPGTKTAQLGAGVGPNAGLLPGMSSLKRDFLRMPNSGESPSTEFTSIIKGISTQNFFLAADEIASGTGDLLKPLTHDISISSVGLLTDTAAGGLKEDFQLLTNRPDLPDSYTDGGIYTTRLGLPSSDAVSEPRWESLQQYARLYQDKVTKADGVPVVRATTPAGWVATSGSNPASGVAGVVQKSAPRGMVLMPTVAKVEVLFSLLARDIYRYSGGAGALVPETAAQLHGPWGDNFRNSSYDYLLHLLYTPIVTLHNPYNVALEFTDMKVVFSNVPFALQVFRNNEPQTTTLAPLDQMYHQSAEMGSVNKRFGMNLKTKTFTNAPGSTTFKLQPGEVKLFTPYIPPNQTWAQEFSNRKFWDYQNDENNMTNNIEGIPGWRGDGIGFDLDWFCPQPLRVSGNEVENGRNMDRGGCIGMRRQDEFHVLFAPLSIPQLSNNKFTVEMFASSATTGTVTSSGAIEMDYESPTGLQNFLIGENGTLRYPAEGTVNTLAMLDSSGDPIKKYSKVKPFALLSARAKTTSGGQNPDHIDGRLATKPWTFAHASVGSVTEKLVSEHPANLSHEIDLQYLENGTLNLLQFGNMDRGNFITGNTSNTGLKFGVMYDIPLDPVQTLSSLNGANPGGSSGYLPRFAQPIGNSWAHPLMSPDKFMEAGPGSTYLDHSFLLNTALYDHYYFSGLAAQTGPFSSGKTTKKLAQDFTEGRPLGDPRLTLHQPNSQPVSTLINQVEEEKEYSRVAAWQLMSGAFNINSTSVPAWKAMLGSIRDSQALVNLVNTTDGTSSLTSLDATDDDETRISRFRLPASRSDADGTDPKTSYWMGPREYSSQDLQKLAEEIVKQVRKRGPFLSLSEFVNRRLGPESNEMAQRGALQQAIDDAGLNQSLADNAAAGYQIELSKVTSYNYRNATAGSGPSYQGAPGYLSQADVLAVLGNAATPRSDTFTIRAYGEARDKTGSVTSTATCEAILQRLPEYVDPADVPEAVPAELVSPINRQFGRRFQIVSFRWLNPAEI